MQIHKYTREEAERILAENNDINDFSNDDDDFFGG
jgi:hypothetical protein